LTFVRFELGHCGSGSAHVVWRNANPKETALNEETASGRQTETGLWSSSNVRRFVPARVGQATVYFEQRPGLVELEPDDDIHPVAQISPSDVFANAGEVVRECVRTVGEQIGRLALEIRPQELSLEFTLTFQAQGKASIPVFVTGEASAQTGLTIRAVWKDRQSEPPTPVD
jgi:hypothetical protein